MEYENIEDVIRKRENEICKREKALKEQKDSYETELERLKKENNILSGEIYDLRTKLQKSEEEYRERLKELAAVSAAKDAYHFCISKIFG